MSNFNLENITVYNMDDKVANALMSLDDFLTSF